MFRRFQFENLLCVVNVCAPDTSDLPDPCVVCVLSSVTDAVSFPQYTKHCDLGQLVQNIVHELERSISGTATSAAPAGFSPGLYPAAGPSVPQPELGTGGVLCVLLEHGTTVPGWGKCPLVCLCG